MKMNVAIGAQLGEHVTPLYRFALSRARDRELALEAVQETLLAALEHGASFAGRSAVRTWLTAILKHKIIDLQRSRQRQASSTDTPDQALDVAQMPAHESVWSNPERALEHKRLSEALGRAISELPDAAAQVFHLRDLQGWSTTEVSAAMGITENNCCVILHRARSAVRESLHQRGFAARLSAL